MGLSCSHEAFDGSYTAFNRLRQHVCEAMGGSFPPHTAEARARYRAEHGEDLSNDWWVYDTDLASQQTHPGLWLFLCHSDCDGELTPEECNLVAIDLERILPRMREIPDDERFGHIARGGGYCAVLQRLIDGCRLAARKGETLVFS